MALNEKSSGHTAITVRSLKRNQMQINLDLGTFCRSVPTLIQSFILDTVNEYLATLGALVSCISTIQVCDCSTITTQLDSHSSSHQHSLRSIIT